MSIIKSLSSWNESQKAKATARMAKSKSVSKANQAAGIAKIEAVDAKVKAKIEQAEKAATAGIEKHSGKVAGLILLALAGWGLNSCMQPDTPEEIRASEVRSYLAKCEWWGFTNEVAELGGAQKYKDWSHLTYIREVKARQDADATLPVDQCKASFEQGERDGREYVRAGKADMR